jgi:hypothetical protein
LSDDARDTRLVDKRYLTLVIRLLVDGQGHVQHGALVGLHEETVGQFRQLEDLPDLVTHWLQTQIHQQD